MDENKRSSLRDLVESDKNIDLVQKLIARGADPNHENSLGETPLHIAVNSTEDNPKIVKLLIDAGGDVNKKSRTMCTVLHYAVVRRKPKVVDVLLKSDIDINFRDEAGGGTALHYAINNEKFFCPFLKTPLQIKTPDLDIVRNLLNHKLLNVNEIDYVGKTALAWAIDDKQYEIVKMLLNKNVSLDTFDLICHCTPLHTTIVQHDCKSAAALLLKKANIFAPSRHGSTPLDFLIDFSNYFKSQPSTLEFQYLCFKVISLCYNVNELLRGKIKDADLLKFLGKCWNEIDRMKSDIIVNDLSVFDFSDCDAKSGFDDPVQQIYKPVIERLVTNVYPEYFCFIYHRISKLKLCKVLYIASSEKYVNEYDVMDCKYKPILQFLKIIRTGLLSEYLSHLEIFSLISALSSLNVEYELDFRKHECYIKGFLDSYPDSHFN